MIYNKWWKMGTKRCPKSDGDRSKASSLNVVNIGGVFVVLFCGLVFAILVSIAEFCFKLRGDSDLHPSKFRKDTAEKLETGSSSLWQQVLSSLLPMFRGDDTNSKDQTDCSSCQSLAQDGNRVRYM